MARLIRSSMTLIHNVEVRDLQVNADERGNLVDVFREDWDEYDPMPTMSYFSMTYPGIIRAWHRHLEGQVDHFVCLKGRIKIGIHDDREGSPTQGEVNTFVIGEHNQQVVRIPGECWHEFEAISDVPTLLINHPSELYDYENPDGERIPYDTDEIPFDWEEVPHG